jgi:hypothetical protein
VYFAAGLISTDTRTNLSRWISFQSFTVVFNPIFPLFRCRNKRLGCAKSTMFSIGGVSALKQHPFFEFMDWFALERLQVTPPFDFAAIAAAGTPGGVAMAGTGAGAGTFATG